MANEKTLNEVEHIKLKSNGLRGSLKESIENQVTGSLAKDDQSLIKFHGMYQQDDRDRREERETKKLETAFSYMLRLRIPGGDITSKQWIATNDIAGKFSTQVIKITTRQTLQLHGILKHNISPTLQDFNQVALDSIAACGDVNRNVVASAHPSFSKLHEQIHHYADKISANLLPKTKAYFELFIDNKKVSNEEEKDPLYQDRFLPRKFKIAIAIPPYNDVDILANDIGLVAIIENEKLIGFNFFVGGGLSYTYGNKNTYSRIATPLGFIAGEENVMKAVYEIATTQRDFGDRSDRKRARLKYTIDTMGEENFKQEIENRIGFKFEKIKPTEFTQRNDFRGWHQNHKGLWFYTLFIENGRVLDDENLKLKTALYKIAQLNKVHFRFTCNQNLILGDIKNEDKTEVENLLIEYGIINIQEKISNVRFGSMACVALPTCPLAMAEAQRYLPTLIDKMEILFEELNFKPKEFITRMTGCPNGCGRPYLAEIGFTGISENHYHLYLGGDLLGLRMNTLYKENLNEEQILAEIKTCIIKYQNEKLDNESFGEFANRKILVK